MSKCVARLIVKTAHGGVALEVYGDDEFLLWATAARAQQLLDLLHGIRPDVERIVLDAATLER